MWVMDLILYMFDTSFDLKCGKLFTQVQEILGASKKVAVL